MNINFNVTPDQNNYISQVNKHQEPIQNITSEVTNQKTNTLNLKVFWKDKSEFSEFRNDVESLFHDVYDGRSSQDQFNERMGNIVGRYITDDMNKEDKEAVIRTIGMFSKLTNQIVANNRISHDPELIEKTKQLHKEDLELMRQLKESGSNATITRANPYKDWINPKILKQYQAAEQMVNQWAEQYAVKNGLNINAVSSPNMDFRDIIKHDNTGLIVNVTK